MDSKTTDRRRSINSRLEGYRNRTSAQRLQALADAVGLEVADAAVLGEAGALGLPLANGMIENVVGTFQLPLGVATNFTVNGRDYLVPMAVEEPSIVAAVSHVAKIVRDGGGFAAWRSLRSPLPSWLLRAHRRMRSCHRVVPSISLTNRRPRSRRGFSILRRGRARTGPFRNRGISVPIRRP